MTTYLTAEEWAERVRRSVEAADKLLTFVRDEQMGVGQAALALMIAARALCENTPDLPPFDWYVARTRELGVERGADTRITSPDWLTTDGKH